MALAAVAAAGACGGPTLPQPVRLTFAGGFAGYRTVAERSAGAFVSVAIHAPVETDGEATYAVVTGASGTIFGHRGFVVTAAHIAKSTGFHARVTTMDGIVRTAQIVDVAPDRELALLRIEPFPGMVAASPAAGKRAGTPALSVGAPGNRAGTVALGRVVDPRHQSRIAYDRYGFDDAIVLAMEVAPGHSGGPVFDNRGRLIGMIASFGLGEPRRVPYVPTGVAYAVPAAAIVHYIDEVAPRGRVPTRR